MQRKDDHIKEALKQSFMPNDFDKIRFAPVLLPETDIENIDITTSYLGKTFKTPIYINAMTGGTEKAKEINDKLSKLAAHFELPMASGSAAIALKEASAVDSFKVIRDNDPDGFILANIGADKSAKNAQEVIKLMNASALQIHCNAPQEAIMPEGERNFVGWKENIKAMMALVDVPVTVKNVGFGMSRSDILMLKNIGIKTIDVAGSGGTNFITIENARRNYPIDGFKNYGFSTVESLLESEGIDGIEILASGGVRNAYDVVKALSLGAKAVGLSRFFLNLAVDHTLDEAKDIIQTFLDDIKKITALLGCRSVSELKNVGKIYDTSLLNFLASRA